MIQTHGLAGMQWVETLRSDRAETWIIRSMAHAAYEPQNQKVPDLARIRNQNQPHTVYHQG